MVEIFASSLNQTTLIKVLINKDAPDVSSSSENGDSKLDAVRRQSKSNEVFEDQKYNSKDFSINSEYSSFSPSQNLMRS